MLVFFINLNLIEFQVECLALFYHFSVTKGFQRFWMESLQKNIQLILEFLRAPFFCLTLFLKHIDDLPDDNAICDIANYANDTTL